MNTPLGLQNKVFVGLMIYVCNRGHENLCSMKSSDLTISCDAEGICNQTRSAEKQSIAKIMMVMVLQTATCTRFQDMRGVQLLFEKLIRFQIDPACARYFCRTPPILHRRLDRGTAMLLSVRVCTLPIQQMEFSRSLYSVRIPFRHRVKMRSRLIFTKSAGSLFNFTVLSGHRKEHR